MFSWDFGVRLNAEKPPPLSGRRWLKCFVNVAHVHVEGESPECGEFTTTAPQTLTIGAKNVTNHGRTTLRRPAIPHPA